MSTRKQLLATWLHRLRVDRLGLAAQRHLLSPFVRALNYHDVPPSRADDFRRQLDGFARDFVCVGPAELDALLAGRWDGPRPGLLLSFDDGLRSHAEVVAPLLEERGWSGWFMVPVGFVDEPVATQRDWAREHCVGHADHPYPDPRIALRWDDVRRLAARHRVCCHTWTHRRLGVPLPPDLLERELGEARARLEREIGRAVDGFAWVGGEEASYSREAAEAIRDAGFRLGFMTNHRVIRPGDDPLRLQRSNVEAHDSEPVVAFQLSGVMDLLYTPKRRRVERLTAVGGGRPRGAAATRAAGVGA